MHETELKENAEAYAEALGFYENTFSKAASDYAVRRTINRYQVLHNQQNRIGVLNIFIKKPGVPKRIIEMTLEAIKYREQVLAEARANLEILKRKPLASKIEQQIMEEMQACLDYYLELTGCKFLTRGNHKNTIVTQAQFDLMQKENKIKFNR